VKIIGMPRLDPHAGEYDAVMDVGPVVSHAEYPATLMVA
jgi:hypothetical protein